MTENERLILYYLLMSTGMLQGGFADLLDEETKSKIKEYQKSIEQICQNAGNADAK